MNRKKLLDLAIHNLVKISEEFAKYPDKLAEFVEGIGKETNQLAMNIIGETLTSRDMMIRENSKRNEIYGIHEGIVGPSDKGKVLFPNKYSIIKRKIYRLSDNFTERMRNGLTNERVL